MANLLDIEQLKEDFLLKGLEVHVHWYDVTGIQVPDPKEQYTKEEAEQYRWWNVECSINVSRANSLADYEKLLNDLRQKRFTVSQVDELRDFLQLQYGEGFQNLAGALKFIVKDTTKEGTREFIPKRRALPEHDDIIEEYQNYLLAVYDALRRSREKASNLKGYKLQAGITITPQARQLFTTDLQNKGFLDNTLKAREVGQLFEGTLKEPLDWQKEKYLLVELVDQLYLKGVIVKYRWETTSRIFTLNGIHHHKDSFSTVGYRTNSENAIKERLKISDITDELTQ